MLRDVVTIDNTASNVWADTAYRSQSNKKWLKTQGGSAASIAGCPGVSRFRITSGAGMPQSQRSTPGSNTW